MNKNFIMLLAVNIIIIFLVVTNYNSIFTDTSKIKDSINFAKNKINQLEIQISEARNRQLASNFDLDEQNEIVNVMAKNFINIKLNPAELNNKGQVYLAVGDVDSILLFSLSLNNAELIKSIIDTIEVNQGTASIIFGIFGEYK